MMLRLCYDNFLFSTRRRLTVSMNVLEMASCMYFVFWINFSVARLIDLSGENVRV